MQDRVALEIEDNLAVGARDPMLTLDSLPRLRFAGVDAVVLSACVQMPSLAAIPEAERRTGLPVVSAAVCTAFQMLERLGLKTVAPAAGTLLSGKYGAAPERKAA